MKIRRTRIRSTKLPPRGSRGPPQMSRVGHILTIMPASLFGTVMKMKVGSRAAVLRPFNGKSIYLLPNEKYSVAYTHWQHPLLDFHYESGGHLSPGRTRRARSA